MTTDYSSGGFATRALKLGQFITTHPRTWRDVPEWLAHRRSSPLDLAVPWWPYAARRFVDAHLTPASSAFEFGGGGSTLWLAKKCRFVEVVEHHQGWAASLEDAVPSNVSIRHVPVDSSGTVVSQKEAEVFFDSYVNSVLANADTDWDLIVVDGRARIECLRRAHPLVKVGGMVLLDDSDRTEYVEASNILRTWKRFDFSGLKPSASMPATTTVWLKVEG